MDYGNIEPDEVLREVIDDLALATSTLERAQRRMVNYYLADRPDYEELSVLIDTATRSTSGAWHVAIEHLRWP